MYTEIAKATLANAPPYSAASFSADFVSDYPLFRLNALSGPVGCRIQAASLRTSTSGVVSPGRRYVIDNKFVCTDFS